MNLYIKDTADAENYATKEGNMSGKNIFIKGFSIPENLQKLIDYDPNLIHIDFEIANDSVEDFNEWFGTKNGDHTKYLYPFGIDGTGGIFALWSAQGLGSGAPVRVVYLGSEGDYAVCAENSDDFLRLLTTDYILFDLVVDGEKVHYKEIMDEDMLDEVLSIKKEYAEWVATKCNLTPIRDEAEILDAISAYSEEFESWIEKRIE
jgi:hypothetical protein